MNSKQYVLVINCGSSSIKFAIIDAQTGESLLSGLAQNLGSKHSRLSIQCGQKNVPYFITHNANYQQALDIIQQSLDDYPDLTKQIIAIGHRVVHGGEHFTHSSLIDSEVKQAINDSAHMAPLHNPANLLGIESTEQAFPALPQVAVFDTAFFQTMPKHAYLYALPYELYQQHGIRRYGFHGTSHYFVCQQAAKELNTPETDINLITMHLGNGCSIAAIKKGKAVDTSMGFTPLEGLIMGNRCGDIDPSIPGFLIEQLHYSAGQVSELLNNSSGLLGISKLSNDCRELEKQAKQGSELAALALEMFAYRLAKYIGAYLAITGPLDALVFTGGIGENSPYIRAKTIAYLHHLGFELDPSLNNHMCQGQSGLISKPASNKIIVLATNEEWVIARDAVKYSRTG